MRHAEPPEFEPGARPCATWAPMLARALLTTSAAVLLLACATRATIETTDGRAEMVRELAVYDDATILAIRAQTTIAVDLALADELRAVLQAARGTSEDLAEIHARPVFDATSVLISVEPRVAEPWKRGERETGVPALDRLLSSYPPSRIQLDSPFEDLFLLEYSSPLKTELLARELDGLDGVVYAEADAFLGDGDDVRARRHGHGWMITFDKASGDDCDVSCTSHQVLHVFVEHGGAASIRPEVDECRLVHDVVDALCAEKRGTLRPLDVCLPAEELLQAYRCCARGYALPGCR
jgi:hypothetical protein